MSSAKAKLALTFIFFYSTFAICVSSNELHFGIQLAKENTYRDTLTPSLDFHYRPYSWGQAKIGTNVLISSKAVEGLIYRFEALLKPFSWIEFLFRGNQRAEFSNAFSHTSLLGLTTFQFKPVTPITFFISAGAYQRWGVVNRSTLLPFTPKPSFSQYDFATELGVKSTFSQTLSGILKVATFDPWEVYNLNNPFIESSIELGKPKTTEKWLATFRYHLLLGFGRLDRLTFGLTYVTSW